MRRDKAIDAVASEVLFQSDGAVDYIVDGDTYQAQGELRLAIGPKVQLIRLTGQVADG
jgi:hypothetical protein